MPMSLETPLRLSFPHIWRENILVFPPAALAWVPKKEILSKDAVGLPSDPRRHWWSVGKWHGEGRKSEGMVMSRLLHGQVELSPAGQLWTEKREGWGFKHPAPSIITRAVSGVAPGVINFEALLVCPLSHEQYEREHPWLENLRYLQEDHKYLQYRPLMLHSGFEGLERKF